MKINKSLKFAQFSYDEVTKNFTIKDKEGNEVKLNKVYSFAFMRFVIRIAQRNWLRTKKIVDKESSPVLTLPELESEAVKDLQQSLEFEDNEDNEAKYEASPSPKGLH
tara:strand:- start:1413 stop:1736 length:324 start_codon:yes stop_codon:yes gene_type:complete